MFEVSEILVQLINTVEFTDHSYSNKSNERKSKYYNPNLIN